jgi:beta-ureidopropionase / N-carbamoyl-L-amino-acid hydrolase
MVHRRGERIGAIGCFIELHIEQGRVRVETDDGPAFGLIDLDRPIAVASSIWPHGRWRFDFTGRADHAGTTRLEDRDDPMLRYALAVSAARELAMELDVLATFGKVRVEPNGVNAIPSRVTAWLDARGAEEDQVRSLVDGLSGRWVAEAPMTGETFAPEKPNRPAVVEASGRTAPPSTSHCAIACPAFSTTHQSCRPAPATTPAFWRRSASPPRCSSSAIPPEFRTLRMSSPRQPTVTPGWTR